MTSSTFYIVSAVLIGACFAEPPVQSGYDYPKPGLGFNPTVSASVGGFVQGTTGYQGVRNFGGFQGAKNYQQTVGGYLGGKNYQQSFGGYLGGKNYQTQQYNTGVTGGGYLGGFTGGQNYQTRQNYISGGYTQPGYVKNTYTTAGFSQGGFVQNNQPGYYQQQQYQQQGYNYPVPSQGFNYYQQQAVFQQKPYVKPEYGVPGVNYKK